MKYQPLHSYVYTLKRLLNNQFTQWLQYLAREVINIENIIKVTESGLVAESAFIWNNDTIYHFSLRNRTGTQQGEFSRDSNFTQELVDDFVNGKYAKSFGVIRGHLELQIDVYPTTEEEVKQYHRGSFNTILVDNLDSKTVINTFVVPVDLHCLQLSETRTDFSNVLIDFDLSNKHTDDFKEMMRLSMMHRDSELSFDYRTL